MRARAAHALAALALGLVFTIAACAKPEATPPESPAVAYGKDPVAVKRGKSLFIGLCGGYCHSLHGGARGDVPDLFDCTWKDGGSDEQIFATISNGVTGTRMVGFKTVMPDGDADIWKLVAFLRADSDCGKK